MAKASVKKGYLMPKSGFSEMAKGGNKTERIPSGGFLQKRSRKRKKR